MFIRNRKKPIPLQKIDASISRLPPNYPQLPLLRKKASNMQKGYNGERKLDYHLKSLTDEYAILSDVTLTIFGKKFQMDSLIITSYAIYVIEVKSYEGTITFNTTLKQFIQNNGEKLQGYKYPITQVENIHFHLLRWLGQHNLDGLPIYYFIAFSEQSTIINVDGNEEAISKVVSYVDEVPVRLMKRDAELTKVKKANNNLKNRIVRTIMRECEDFDYDVFEKFDIDKRDLLPGVHCPECRRLGMERIYGKWHCKKCDTYSKDAHRKALHDFFLLISNTITNKQCRYFLNISSRHVARKILLHSNLFLEKGTQKWKVKL